MGLIARFRSWLRRSAESSDRRSAGSSDGRSDDSSSGGSPTETGPSDGPVDFDELDRASIGTRADVVYETGLTPEQFVVALVEAHDGSLRQQAFTDHVDWSESLVSRVLRAMEEEGRVVRTRVGNGNVVYTPEEAPDDDLRSAERRE